MKGIDPRLETAMVPGYNVRLVRSTELHRRNRSIWVPAARWPDRAMLLDPLSPWDSATYELCDIAPYLIPAGVMRHEEAMRSPRASSLLLHHIAEDLEDQGQRTITPTGRNA
jgi:hypothetical protein